MTARYWVLRRTGFGFLSREDDGDRWDILGHETRLFSSREDAEKEGKGWTWETDIVQVEFILRII